MGAADADDGDLLTLEAIVAQLFELLLMIVSCAAYQVADCVVDCVHSCVGRRALCSETQCLPLHCCGDVSPTHQSSTYPVNPSCIVSYSKTALVKQ